MVHGSNVSNRVHGKRVAPAAYAGSFPGLLEDLGTPTRADLLRDRLILGPSRLGREKFRAVAKSVVEATSGRNRIDQVKVWVATRTMRFNSASPGRKKRVTEARTGFR